MENPRLPSARQFEVCYLLSRTSLRRVSAAFSVLAVVWMHLTLFSKTPPQVLLPPSVIGYLGGFGVQVFFVISGYIITRLMLREHEKYGRFSAFGFYIRRALRILPAYWLYLISVFILSSGGTPRHDLDKSRRFFKQY